MKLEPGDVLAMADEQKLVVLEALIIGILADGKVHTEEVKRFDEIVGSLPWGMDKPVLQALIAKTQERVKATKTPQEVTDFVIGMAQRITDPTLRDKTFYTMCTVMAADGVVNNLEKAAIGMFVLAFGITSDRLATIRSALGGTPKAPPGPDSAN